MTADWNLRMAGSARAPPGISYFDIQTLLGIASLSFCNNFQDLFTSTTGAFRGPPPSCSGTLLSLVGDVMGCRSLFVTLFCHILLVISGKSAVLVYVSSGKEHRYISLLSLLSSRDLRKAMLMYSNVLNELCMILSLLTQFCAVSTRLSCLSILIVTLRELYAFHIPGIQPEHLAVFPRQMDSQMGPFRTKTSPLLYLQYFSALDLDSMCLGLPISASFHVSLQPCESFGLRASRLMSSLCWYTRDPLMSVLTSSRIEDGPSASMIYVASLSASRQD